MRWMGRAGFAFWPTWRKSWRWQPRPARWNAVRVIHVGPLLLAWSLSPRHVK